MSDDWLTEPYYKDEWVTLYCGRCEDILPSLCGIDLIFTSPPYNLGVSTGGGFAGIGHYSELGGLKKRGGGGKWSGGALADGYGEYSDALPTAEYAVWQRQVLQLCWLTLSPRGAIFYNHKPRIQRGECWLPLSLNPGLPLRQIITWARAGGINFAPTHYVPTYEWILVFAKPDFRLRAKAASGAGDLWYIPQESYTQHPAPFPVGLPRRAIETVCPRLVLDPMSGSGSTLRAAKDCGVRSIGIELSPAYCDLAVEWGLSGSKRCAVSSMDGEEMG